MELLDERFKMDEEFLASEYFFYSYGIVVDERVAPERIVLRAYGKMCAMGVSSCIKLQPFCYDNKICLYAKLNNEFLDLILVNILHHSQREINTTEEYSDFELTLRPTRDFKAQLLSRGEWIEVLEPQSLADEIIEWHQNAIERYRK